MLFSSTYLFTTSIIASPYLSIFLGPNPATSFNFSTSNGYLPLISFSVFFVIIIRCGKLSILAYFPLTFLSCSYSFWSVVTSKKSCFASSFSFKTFDLSSSSVLLSILLSTIYCSITLIKSCPYFSYLIWPTPDIFNNSSSSVGYVFAIDNKVESPNTIYGAIFSFTAIVFLKSDKIPNNSFLFLTSLAILTSLNWTFISPFKTLDDWELRLIVGKLPLEPRFSLTSKNPWDTNVFIKAFNPSLV